MQIKATRNVHQNDLCPSMKETRKQVQDATGACKIIFHKDGTLTLESHPDRELHGLVKMRELFPLARIIHHEFKQRQEQNGPYRYIVEIITYNLTGGQPNAV